MSRTPEPGDIIQGRFEIDHHIGSGGFATVWRGQDRQTGLDVALKVPNDSSHGLSEVRSRFQQELAVLKHYTSVASPNTIVHFVEGRVTVGETFLALEYIEGEELTEAAGSSALGFGSEAALGLGMAVTGAIAFLHRNDVLYLDLKPSNILLRMSGHPVLIDFNTAVDEMGDTSTIFYEDSYKPPEQTPTDMRDQTTGPWSDVYACGKLLFYLLTGEELQTGETSSDGVDPRRHGATCSRDIASEIQNATQLDPNRRHSDGTELLRALRRAMNQTTVTAEIEHINTGVMYQITPDTVMGRRSKKEQIPDIVLDDPEQHISPKQLRFEYDTGDWYLYDTSLNGTFVDAGEGWQRILSESGYHRLRKSTDVNLEDEPPPVAGILTNGCKFAPVHPDYNSTFRFWSD